MADIRNQLVKDTYNYVLQSDLSTGYVYRIGGDVPVNPIFSSGLTILNNFKYSNGTEQNGYVLYSDGSGNAYWGAPPSGSGGTISGDYLPLSGGTVSGATLFTVGLSANTISATTYLNLPQLSGDYLPLSGGTVSGATLFTAGLSANTISATTYYNLPVSGLTEGSNISITGSNGNYTISFTGTSGSGLLYFVSSSTPTTTQSGDRWFNTNTGVELVWINDGDSSQWVQPFSVPGPLSPDAGYYLTTGITTSQTITWDKTYWGISGSSNVNLTLPSTTSKEGYYLIIKDESGICGNYRIRLTPTSGTIDGNNYVDMNINYMSLTCLVRGGNWYLI